MTDTTTDTTIEIFNEKLEKFNAMPKYKQGSQGWHDQRHGYLTASTIVSALGLSGEASRKALLLNKASYGKYGGFNGNDATHWGNKFEPVANAVYCHKRGNIIVHDFGMITNEQYPILGVSPDGILEDRMLEIKCPYSRVINGHIKFEYWHQMQEQMWVCDYTKCDFLECKFTAIYEGLFWSLGNKTYRGIIALCINTESNEINYLYSPVCAESNTELELWICSVENSTDHLIYIGKTFWRLDKYNCQTVERDPEWMTDNYPILEKFWEELQHYRQIGYESLLKPSQQTTQQSDWKPEPSIGVCLL